MTPTAARASDRPRGTADRSSSLGAPFRDSIACWQVGVALLALLLSALWITDSALRDPKVPFLSRGLAAGPQWITPHSAIQTDAIWVDFEHVPAFTFVKRFTLGVVPSGAHVRLRAVGRATLSINDQSLWASDPKRSWKRDSELDASGALLAGENEIRVATANPRGPALLQLALLDGSDLPIVETDPSWRAIGPGEQPLRTMRADDTRVDPQSFATPSTVSSLVEKAGVLSLLFVLGAALDPVLRHNLKGRSLARAPEAVLAAATLFWILVYALRAASLPVGTGFDVVGHLKYVDFILERHALPTATDGWSMYHPPLAHLVIAAIVGFFEVARGDAAARWLYRLPMFLSGLGNVWATWFTARLLFAGDPLRVGLATGFAALLPMNLYMSAYVSNEPLHGFLVSLSLCLACALLVRPRISPARAAALSVSLGLAILTKFTALIAVPVCACFVGLMQWIVLRAPLSRALATGAAVASGAAAVGGWVYARNLVLFGRPVVGNWNLPGPRIWWQQPGFHTLDYYTSFGRALSRPFFSARASFWDSVYSTFWGDGLAAGVIRLAARHDAWNYDYMTAGYLLALPATVLLVVGFGRAVHFALSDSDLGRRLAMSLLVAFLYTGGFALFAITLELPFYAQAKAFYLLSTIVALSIAAALGIAWTFESLGDSKWLPIRMVYSGWLCTLAGAVVLSFLG